MEHQYLETLKDVLGTGVDTENRTDVDTRAVFGRQMRFNLSEGFPALTTKRLAWRAVVSELLWFLEGNTDERRLCEIQHGTRDPAKNTIWRANADEQGRALGYENTDFVKELGPVYGAQWRNFNGVDQIEWVINQIKTNPTSRRLIVSAWNPPEIEKMALPPCHTLFQFSVQNDRLSCQLYQRSADLFLGSPFNIASYALLTHIISQITGYRVGEFVYTLGDAHIYHNHFDAVREQLSRTPKAFSTLQMPEFESLAEVLRTSPDDYVLEGYDPAPAIKAPMAV
jgi:thymidylate synthase